MLRNFSSTECGALFDLIFPLDHTVSICDDLAFLLLISRQVSTSRMEAHLNYWMISQPMKLVYLLVHGKFKIPRTYHEDLKILKSSGS